MRLMISIFVLIFLSNGFATAFKVEKIRLGNKVIIVEIADSEKTRSLGLMFRKKIPEDSGMLFVFEEERILSFWMKNTLIPLSIGYFDQHQKLIQVLEMVPEKNLAKPQLYISKSSAKFALEMTKGWFAQNKIRAGTKFEFLK